MPPIRKGDGTEIAPDGIKQVRAGDGRVFFDAIPDSVLYNGGEGEDEWVEGYSEGSGDTQKTSDSLYLQAEGDGDNERTWVIDNSVDLTDYSEVEISWEGNAFVSGVEESGVFLVVSSSKSDGHGTFDERLSYDEDFERTTDILDISSLSGSYYIRIHVIDNFDFSRGYEADAFVVGVND